MELANNGVVAGAIGPEAIPPLAESKDAGGALRHLCTIVSFQELLRLRLVCKFWDKTIREHPIYYDKMTVVFPRGWKRTRSPQYRANMAATTKQARHLRNILFDRYEFRANLFSRVIWPQAKLSVTTLVFKDVSIRCERMAVLLNETRDLLSVTLLNMNFPCPSYHYDERDRLVHHRDRRIVCVHPTVQNAIRRLPNPGRVRSVVCRGFPVLPNCVMLVLAHRSKGTLLEFEMSGSVRAPDDNILPTVADGESNLVTHLLNGTTSRQDPPFVLQKLTLRNNSSDLSMLPRLQELFRTLPTQEIVLAQGDGNSLVQTGRIMDFLRWQRQHPPNEYLHTLDLTVHETWNVAQLTELLSQIHRLRKIRLEFGQRSPERRNLNLIRAVQDKVNLVELEVCASPDVAELDLINPGYLDFLPPNLRKLRLDHHGLVPEVLSRLLNGQFIGKLRELEVMRGAGVNNGVMAQIIRTLPDLQKLSINGSAALTDTGLLGWPQRTIEFLRRTQCYASIIHANESQEQLVGPSIKDLTHLRALNLKGCTKVSDISVIRGFIFQQLRELDISQLNVTDLGIMWLGKNNPGLEKLTCKNNGKISRFGLNQVLQSFTGVRHIYTTKRVTKKELGNIKFENSEKFETFVHSTCK